jgi:NADPH:quinone reductase-like Zn-dependent oxidoreductase
MKEVILSVSKDAGVEVSIIDSLIPKPGPNEVQIKVVAVAMNPKYWFVSRSSRLVLARF